MSVQLVLTIIFGTFESFTFSGAAYGWASLYPVLIEEGFFSDGCDQNNSLRTTYNECESQVDVCSKSFLLTFLMR